MAGIWAFGESEQWPRDRIDEAVKALENQLGDFLSPR